MINNITAMVDTIGNHKTINKLCRPIVLEYIIYKDAKNGQDMLHLKFGDYLLTYTVCGFDIKMQAKIVKGREETPELITLLCDIAALLYHDALKPYLLTKTSPPVTILPRAIREFFDMLTISLKDKYPNAAFKIVDSGEPNRIPALPKRVNRIKI